MKRLLFLGIIGMSSVLNAMPSINGTTGLITVPTAESLKYREVNIAYDHFFSESSQTDTYKIKANMGLFENWEFGLVKGERPAEGAFLNMKYYLMQDEALYPFFVALGAENVFSANLTRLYMVSSKRFEGGFSGHLGFTAEFTQSDDINPYIMGGLEYYFTNEFAGLIDITGEQQVYMINLGTRFFINNAFGLRFNIVDIGNSTGNGIQYGVGISLERFL